MLLARLSLLALALAPILAHAGDPLDRRIRPQLPTTVKTLGSAVTYYLGPTGLRLFLQTPGGGDARALAARPVRSVPADAPVVSVREALKAILPANTKLLLDTKAGAVTLAPSDGPAELASATLLSSPDTTPAEVAPTPTGTAIAQSLDELAKVSPPPIQPATASTPSASKPSPAGAELVLEAPKTPTPTDQVATTTPIAAAPPAQAAAVAVDPPPAPATPPPPSYAIHAGTTVRNELEVWAREEGMALVWDAPFDVPVVADYALPAASFREAVTALLRATNAGLAARGLPARLRADELPNRTLRVYAP
jgi:hypothetical protein